MWKTKSMTWRAEGQEYGSRYRLVNVPSSYVLSSLTYDVRIEERQPTERGMQANRPIGQLADRRMLGSHAVTPSCHPTGRRMQGNHRSRARHAARPNWECSEIAAAEPSRPTDRVENARKPPDNWAADLAENVKKSRNWARFPVDRAENAGQQQYWSCVCQFVCMLIDL